MVGEGLHTWPSPSHKAELTPSDPETQALTQKSHNTPSHFWGPLEYVRASPQGFFIHLTIYQACVCARHCSRCQRYRNAENNQNLSPDILEALGKIVWRANIAYELSKLLNETYSIFLLEQACLHSDLEGQVLIWIFRYLVYWARM